MRPSRLAIGWCALIAAFVGVAHARQPSTLPPVPYPAENPHSEAKRVLGKILFWDEQLSSDLTMSCGSCHMPASGGTDPVRARAPGLDGRPNTPDDIFASLAMIFTNANNDYEPAPVFDLNRQITSRTANSAILAMYAPNLFWDGRATSRFDDPETGETVIASGGALESQSVAPPASDVEMAHADFEWIETTLRLASARPLALAEAIPADVQGAIDQHPDYPALFREAFGDSSITASRIAMAIATYERTLIPDQSPWDRFTLGETTALTPQQVQGWNTFRTSRCAICHTPPMFTDNTFRNIGLRPLVEDNGRQGVTGNPADAGRFKTPSLRNVGLRASLMHTGQFTTTNQVFPFYAGPGAPGNNNRDPLLPVPIPPQQQPAIVDFLVNGLTDLRVAGEQFPFDRPSLFAQRASQHIVLVGAATTGADAIAPRMIASAPPLLGNAAFKIGLDDALGGATAWVAISNTPPVAGALIADSLEGPISVGGAGSGSGFATFHWPIPLDSRLDTDTVYMQWLIADPTAPNGFARSRTVQLTLFCGMGECPSACPGDWNGSGGAPNSADFLAYLNDFSAHDPAADLAPAGGDGNFDSSDFLAYLNLFTQGCSA
jgi:cytochrome c peroxidase